MARSTRSLGPRQVQTLGMVGRCDSLPEHARYQDTGCEVSPSCLTCPLPVCRYEHPGGIRAARAIGTAERVKELREAGLLFREIAAEVGVSKSSARRLSRLERRQ